MKNLFKGWASIIALALIAMVTMVSCGEEEPPPPVVLDGIYVKGDATALTALDSKGMLETTRNERNQTERQTLKEIYIAVSASGTFSLVDVTGGVETMWGAGSDFAEVPAEELDGEEPKNGLWRGTYTPDGAAFSVPEDGLYHIMLDTELGKMAIAKVVWGVIGAASPGGWSESTNLTASFDKNMMDFTGSEIAMKKGDFKFRYSDNWKVYLDTTEVLPDSDNKGVAVNTNFGGAVDALVPGGDNINMTDPAYYTISVKWELGMGTTVTLTRGDDLPSTDYSTYNMGFVGDGIEISGSQHNWDSTVELMLPTVDGSVYTWAWTGIGVTDAGSFKIRQNNDWDGLILGYPQVTMAGSAAGNFDTNGDGNFVPKSAATYDFTLTVDGTVNDFTLTVEPSSK